MRLDDWVSVLNIIDSALRHGFSDSELREIWETVPEDSVVRVRHSKQPPHYMMVGYTGHGMPVELIAYTDGFDWWLFHACAPVTPGFRREYVRSGGVL